MRSRSSKHAKEMERVKLREEQPHLSGAYIRSLVKQLSSSRTKQPINPPKVESDIGFGDGDGDGDRIHTNIPNLDEGFSETQPQTQTPPPPQHKKQVRRRLHTTRPYQERHLNMAEARREIVTALKFHREAMKQANERQPPPPEPPLPPQQNPHPLPKSRKNPRIYPSNTPTFSNYINNIPTPFSYPPPPNPYAWASPPIEPLGPINDHLNLGLPNQPLGLNLNLHDFNNMDTALFQYNDNNPSIYPCYSSSPSCSLSPSPALSSTDATSSSVDLPPNDAFHSAMDEEEMAMIRSIGDQHDMEWNDTLNLVTSAWWFKFLKNMEPIPETNEDGFHWFDGVMDIPTWFGESCFTHEDLDEFPFT